jgi:hypothetical protein
LWTSTEILIKWWPENSEAPSFYRLEPRESKRPAIAIDLEMTPNAEEKPVLGKSRGNIRRRKDNEEFEDIPPAKRQATPRKLRPRANDSHAQKMALEPPVGKVVASGRGWYTIEVDAD